MSRAKKHRAAAAAAVVADSKKSTVPRYVREAQEAARRAEEEAQGGPLVALRVGNYQFPLFDNAHAVFGAQRIHYPLENEVPEGYTRRTNVYNQIASALFFGQGQLADFGLSVADGMHRGQVMSAIAALLRSFDPSHDHKIATVAWCLASWTRGNPLKP